MQVRLKASAPELVKLSAGNYHREFRRADEPFELGGAEVLSLDKPEVWASLSTDAAARREWTILEPFALFDLLADGETPEAV